MNITLRARETSRILDVTGDMDLNGSPTLRKALFEALHQAPKVVLNLSAIRYIDSSGIAVLLEAQRESQRLNRRFVLFGMSPAVHDVFKLTHVIRIFQVADTEEQALDGGNDTGNPDEGTSHAVREA
jgi:anti-sigma B factor antagonist